MVIPVIARRRACQEGGHRAHVVDLGQAAEGCLALLLQDDRVEVLQSGGSARVWIGPGERACTRMPFGPSS